MDYLTNSKEMAAQLARLVRDKGGRAFYVGGYVRDLLLDKENKDIDIEVHGISRDTLYEILAGLGTPLEYGSSFGIFSLSGYDLDIALPRTDRKTGDGHRDFDVDVDPYMGYEAAARRRDFTINALMMDVLTGEVLDFFGGRKDLQEGIIRHVDENTFPEDPLRVLRGAQFAARFGFTVAPETVELCRGMDISTLPCERVEEEMKKALLKSERPSIFFQVLREMDQLDVWFPEVKALIGVPQDPLYHPEGDVWNHTMQVLDNAVPLSDGASDKYYFLMLALVHDFGKVLTTEEVNGRIHAYGHEFRGLEPVGNFINRITDKKELIRYLINMSEYHMKPNILANSKSKVKKTNQLFDSVVSPLDLILFSRADKPVLAGDKPYTDNSVWLLERYKIYEETMAKPHVKGKDLIEAGLQPGTYFTELLKYARKLRLAGIDKENALSQVIGLYNTMLKNGQIEIEEENEEK